MATAPNAPVPSPASRPQARSRETMPDPQPHNLLLVLSIVLCSCTAIVCLAIWTWPAATVSHELQTENEKLMQLQAALDRNAATRETELSEADRAVARKTEQVAALNQLLTGQQNTATPEELEHLQAEIEALKKQSARPPAPPAGTGPPPPQVTEKLSAEVLQRVNANLVALVDERDEMICATLLNGWCVTTAKQTHVLKAARGPELHMIEIGGYIIGGKRCQFAWRYGIRVLAPAVDKSHAGGFQTTDFSIGSSTKDPLFCICHEVIDGQPRNNVVEAGRYIATVPIRGELLLKTSLPRRSDMAGAPVVTKDGKLIGIQLPPLDDEPIDSLVLPISLVASEVVLPP